MALEVIGSGLGRTGTKSLQTALAQLGFGPCHHMVEIFAHPETMPLWIAAGEGRPDWDTIFSGYRSAVAYIERKSIVAVGTSGTDLTRDGGETWKKIGSEDLNAVAAKGKNAVWAVGPKGMVAKFQ